MSVKYFPRTLNRVFFALSDPTRRAIIARLTAGELRVTELAAPFAISLVAVSRHIRVLENAGLLKRSKHGREYHLRLVAEPLAEVSSWIDQYERYWTSALDDIKAKAEQKTRERAAQQQKP